jgi:hypothetical protein
VNRPGLMHPRLCVNDRSVVTGLCIVVGLGFGGWASVEAVHESAGVVPVDPVGDDGLEGVEAGEGSAAKGGVVAGAFGLVEPDGGLG